MQNKNDFKNPSAWLANTLRDPAARRAYEASYFWQLRRMQLGERSDGVCERCKKYPYKFVHHLTYEHYGSELLCELQAVCVHCHKFIHHKSHYDPLIDDGPVQRILAFK